MSMQPGGTYCGTDNINNMIEVNVNNNVITVLGQEYVLPSPVLYKLTTTLPNSLIYVTSTNGGLLQEAVQITVNLNGNEQAIPLVTYNRYYYMTKQAQFAATQVTVNANGSMSAILDPTAINPQEYNGQEFTLTGNVLTAQTTLIGTSIAGETIPASGS